MSPGSRSKSSIVRLVVAGIVILALFDYPLQRDRLQLNMSAWFILFIAGIFEIGWAVGLKFTHGWSRAWPSILTIAAMIVSMYLLEWAARTLPIGTAYAVWTGIGAIGTAVVGVLWLGEQASAMRLLSIMLIVAGVAGLKLSGGGH
jgi:quaternary ammonium compound-resistance protein SugE